MSDEQYLEEKTNLSRWIIREINRELAERWNPPAGVHSRAGNEK